MRLFPLIFVFAFFVQLIPAQDTTSTLIRNIDFITHSKNDSIHFVPALPSLIQKAGAPKAFYEYYWEFGDGNYSMIESPVYQYNDSEEKEVLFLATGKYDNGTAPRSRKKKLKPIITETKPVSNPICAEPAMLLEGQYLAMQAIRSPKANEELICVLEYAQFATAGINGHIMIFFNEKIYPHSHFQFTESRKHFGEKQVEIPSYTSHSSLAAFDMWAGNEDPLSWYDILLPDELATETLADVSGRYRESVSFSFDGLKSLETRRMFLSFQGLQSMLADTHAIVFMTAILISEDQKIVKSFDLEMEIVNSHDPNYVSVSPNRHNFRAIKSKHSEFKINFQNIGEGPADHIEITADTGPGWSIDDFDLLNYAPYCLKCPTGEVSWSCLAIDTLEGKLRFTFKNVYLPGIHQKGHYRKKETKGYVKYRLKANNEIQKLPQSARASIVFDKNAPVITPNAFIDFKPGFSAGIMLGKHLFFSKEIPDPYFIGLSLSPFKSYKSYYQMEIIFGWRNNFTDLKNINELYSYPIPNPDFGILSVDSIVSGTIEIVKDFYYFQFVPFQWRKNWNRWWSTGAGTALGLNVLKERTLSNINSQILHYVCEGPVTGHEDCELIDFLTAHHSDQNIRNQTSTQFLLDVFADVQFGSVRSGPYIALRPGWRMIGKPDFYISIFAGFKF